MATRMKDKDWEQMVLGYLRTKGYKQAEDMFRQESKTQSLEQMAFNVDSNPSLTNYISFYNPNEANAAAYEESFSALRNWAHNSLDLYRPELLALLYPIFVHCYLDLVAKGFANEARGFMEKFRKDFEERNLNEMIRLSSITTPQHLEENDLAKTLRRNKFTLRICSYSFELFISFLQQSNYMIILALTNQYLDLKVFSGHPTTLVEEEYKAITGAGSRPEPDQAQVNQKPVLFGMLQDEPRWGVKKEGEENEPKPAITRVPEPSLEDIRKRVALSAMSLPSICFFTLLNTYHSLNSVEIASDSSAVAGCFSNGVVKVWDMKKKDTDTTLLADAASQGVRQNGDITKNSKAKQPTQDYTTLIGHSGAVYSCAFSSDNKYLFTGSEDNTARLWSMETKTNLVCYKGHNYPVWSIDCSSLGYYFATASHDRTARLWSTDHIYPLRIFAGHLGDVDCVKFHPNCNYIATGSADKSVRLWEVNTGECARIFTGHLGPVNCLAFSPDGKTLASAGEDRNIILWDLGSGKKIKTLGGHRKRVWSVDFSAEGTLLASSSADNTVCLWDVNRAKAHSHSSSASSVPPVATNGDTSGGSSSDSSASPATSGSANSTPLGAVTTLKPSGASSELLAMYPTKKTPVYTVKFTRRNLLLAAGPFSDPSN